uniref:DUF2750 domain-containing protein n=1 Tax=uncultured Thiotrichaceae bacterium TaxID=298394 RepID=A0A6S6TPT2_9GAMM|nr:MAG: Unknown protein [uncultured Thiotrichaceae bacterium]
MNQQLTPFEMTYDQFIAEIQQTEQVWGLFNASDESWAVCSSEAYEETDVLPFWSGESAAAALCTNEWSVYSPTVIPLEEFINDWLPGMHEDDAMVGPNWDVELEGLEVEPADVAAELEAGEE